MTTYDWTQDIGLYPFVFHVFLVLFSCLVTKVTANTPECCSYCVAPKVQFVIANVKRVASIGPTKTLPENLMETDFHIFKVLNDC